MSSIILRVGTRYLAGLLIIFSLYMLLRGHNEPGGGFIGGLIGASAFALLTVSHGVEAARQTLRLDPHSLTGLGVATALFAGLLSLPFGSEPFSGIWVFLGADGGGQGVPLSTVLLFDVGVWLVVVGAVVTLIFELETLIRSDTTPARTTDKTQEHRN